VDNNSITSIKTLSISPEFKPEEENVSQPSEVLEMSSISKKLLSFAKRYSFSYILELQMFWIYQRTR